MLQMIFIINIIKNVPPASLFWVGLDTRQDRLGQKEIQVPSDFVHPWFFRLRAAIVKIVTEFNGK